MTEPSEPDNTSTGELPSTAYAVLAVLSVNDEELSPREIRTRSHYTLRHFYWSPAVSHIRKELRRLCELGLVEERDTTVVGRVRRSQVYQTTSAGEAALARWVARSDTGESVIVKNSVLLRVFLGAKAPLETMLSVLDTRIAEIEEAINDANWSSRRASELGLADQENLRFSRAVSEYNLRSLYFEQTNLRQLRAQIEGFDTAAFTKDISRPRGEIRHRHTPPH
ncbi:MarR family transcriptional regulator [Nocardia sp. CA2R105]|uniref:PadR family transcriptional regulator n=1 Tax=Nocardia coffeae TaxID=2873381 RepID=UPI001CA742A3|nr:MarR family transcriptional regulator [Nocardia coffeae]MBY8856805.1 MarR family transcriptional regulator [Nocardia coffeae]